MQRKMNSRVHRIRRGDIVRVTWRDAVEGSTPVNLSEMRAADLRKSTDSTLVVVGRFFRLVNGRMILEDVFREESGNNVLYEKRAHGKWLSIPMGVVTQVTTLRELDQLMAEQTKRRRTIFKQLRFIPRSRRMPNGELGKMLYLT